MTFMPYEAWRIAFQSSEQAARSDYLTSIQLATNLQEVTEQNKSLLEFIKEISGQEPEKPDYWSSCSQCQRNIEDAQGLILKGG